MRRNRLLSLIFFPGLVVLAYQCLLLTGIGGWLETFLYDAWFKVRGAVKVPAEIAVISIDERDFSRAKVDATGFWPRKKYAEILEELAKQGVRAVAMDIMFRMNESDTEANAALQAALRKLPSVLPVQNKAVPGKTGLDIIEIRPEEGFVEAAVGLGNPGVVLDRDEAVRRFPAAGQSAPPLSARALEAAGFKPVLPPSGKAFLNYYGARGVIPAISYSKLMGLDGALEPEALKGKVVFVGLFTDLAGPSFAADIFKTPYSSFGGPRDYGVELHAVAAANLLDGSWIRKPAQEWLWISAFLIAAVIILSKVKVKSAAIFITALWLVGPAASYFAFLHHFWLSVFCPLLALSAGYLGWALFDSDTRAKESEHSFLRFRTSLGKYLPRGIINAMSKENFDPVSDRKDLEEGLYLIFNALQHRESSEVPEDLEQVKVIDGDYRIQRVLGKGAMAVVLLVSDTVSKEERALKLTRIEDPEQAGDGESPGEGESAEDREEAVWRKKRMFRAEVQRLM